MGKELTPWAFLKQFTDARLAQGRSGISLPTPELLSFQQAHASARDAVHTAVDFSKLTQQLSAHPEGLVRVRSQVSSRAEYLRRPDLGRKLAPQSRAELEERAGVFDVAVVVGDGLSAQALVHAPQLLERLLPTVRTSELKLAPLILAEQARVALGDDIALALGARLVLMLLGERPGLSSPDSLGAYLTYQPQALTRDSARNCVSNIRPAGLSPELAAWRLHHLITQALTRELSGIDLKDESGEPPHGWLMVDG